MRVALVTALALLAIPQTEASTACMGRKEAKKAFGGAYLLWHRNSHGRRCYSPREAVAFMPQRGMQRERESKPPKPNPPPIDIAPVPVRIQPVRAATPFVERFQEVRQVTGVPSPQPKPAPIKPESNVSPAAALFALGGVLALVSGLAWWLAGGRRRPGTAAADRHAARPSPAARIPCSQSRVLAPWAWGG